MNITVNNCQQFTQKGSATMKNAVQSDNVRTELLSLKQQMEIVETKIGFTCEPKLIDALSYELLGLRARMGYLIDRAKGA